MFWAIKSNLSIMACPKKSSYHWVTLYNKWIWNLITATTTQNVYSSGHLCLQPTALIDICLHTFHYLLLSPLSIHSIFGRKHEPKCFKRVTDAYSRFMYIHCVPKSLYLTSPVWYGVKVSIPRQGGGHVCFWTPHFDRGLKKSPVQAKKFWGPFFQKFDGKISKI